MKKTIPVSFCFLLCKYTSKHYNSTTTSANSFQKAKRIPSYKNTSSNSDIQWKLIGVLLRTWITGIDIFYKMGLNSYFYFTFIEALSSSASNWAGVLSRATTTSSRWLFRTFFKASSRLCDRKNTKYTKPVNGKKLLFSYIAEISLISDESWSTSFV